MSKDRESQLEAIILKVTAERDTLRKYIRKDLKEICINLMNETAPLQVAGEHSVYYEGIAAVLRAIDTVSSEAPEQGESMKGKPATQVTGWLGKRGVYVDVLPHSQGELTCQCTHTRSSSAYAMVARGFITDSSKCPIHSGEPAKPLADPVDEWPLDIGDEVRRESE